MCAPIIFDLPPVPEQTSAATPLRKLPRDVCVVPRLLLVQGVRVSIPRTKAG